MEIGHQIVEEEQGGKRRAGYGEKIIEEQSAKLTARYGRGWSVPNLKNIRQLFMTYSNWLNTVEPIDPQRLNGVYPIEKSATALRKSESANSVNAVYEIPKFTLSWSHYLLLMRIEDPVGRPFRYPRPPMRARRGRLPPLCRNG